jgi:hypothetical protein
LESGFKVFGKVSIDPSEGALDNPAPGQDDKAAEGIGAFDDLDCPLADFVEGGIELGPAVGGLAVLAAWTAPFASGRQVLTFRTRA